MILADFQPGILFLLLWGLLSWFTSRKKKQLKKENGSGQKKAKAVPDIFERLKKLQDHLASEVDILPTRSEPDELEFDEFPEEPEVIVEPEPPIPIPDLEIPGQDEETDPGIAFPSASARKTNWIRSALHQKQELKRIILLREVLSEPRAIKPYGGNN